MELNVLNGDNLQFRYLVMYVFDFNNIQKIYITIGDVNLEKIEIFTKDNSYIATVICSKSCAVAWVYDNILNNCSDYSPEVEICDKKVRLLKYRL
jgi:hypothetical protein